MAALVMQALGCDVAALNTVQFSKIISPFLCLSAFRNREGILED